MSDTQPEYAEVPFGATAVRLDWRVCGNPCDCHTLAIVADMADGGEVDLWESEPAHPACGDAASDAADEQRLREAVHAAAGHYGFAERMDLSGPFHEWAEANPPVPIQWQDEDGNVLDPAEPEPPQIEVVEVPASAMRMLPTAPGTCPVCATPHPSDAAHNFQSLTYQIGFRMRHGRDATWEDTVAHLSPESRAAWRQSSETVFARVNREKGLDLKWTTPPPGVEPIAEPGGAEPPKEA